MVIRRYLSCRRSVVVHSGSLPPLLWLPTFARKPVVGLRRAEIAALDVEGIHFVEDGSGYANVRGKRTRANADGKRDAAFDSATGSIIAEYLEATAYTSGPLFRNKYNKRMSVHWVYVIVKSAIGRAGLQDEIQACHDLRRAFATHFRRQTKDKDLLRRQLGHAKYSTTDTYTLLEVEDIRRELVSPLSTSPT